MRALRRMLVWSATMAGGSYIIYRYILNDNAKRHVQTAIKTIRDSYQRLNQMVEDTTGIVIEEDSNTLPNRAKTIQQWKDIGY